MILTYELKHRRAIEAAGVTPLEHMIRSSWASHQLPPYQAIAAGAFVDELHAYVNEARWVVKCPTELCRGAQLAFDTDHRFVCVECAAGPFAVIWPPEREAIETLLLQRPLPATLNWYPGESLEQLAYENAEHGIVP